MGIIQKLAALFQGRENEAGPPQQQQEPEPVVPVTGSAADVVRDPVTVPAQGPQVPLVISEPRRNAEPKDTGVKKVMIDEAALSVLDLRELPSSRFRIVGSGFWVTDSGRYRHGGHAYLLVREPKNEWDANAVAVYGKGRKVGYLSEAKAAALAPLLDQVAFDAFRVGGAPPGGNSIHMWADIPAVPKLRTFVKSLDKGPV